MPGAAPPSTSPSPRIQATGTGTPVPLFVVEDNPGDILLLREALKAHGLEADITTATTGEEAIATVEAVDRDPNMQCPRMIILDLNLPRKHGFEVLTAIRKSTRCGAIPVVILSSSNTAVDREIGLRLGANEYLRKPTDLSAMLRIGAVIKTILETYT